MQPVGEMKVEKTKRVISIQQRMVTTILQILMYWQQVSKVSQMP